MPWTAGINDRAGGAKRRTSVWRSYFLSTILASPSAFRHHFFQTFVDDFYFHRLWQTQNRRHVADTKIYSRIARFQTIFISFQVSARHRRQRGRFPSVRFAA